MYFNGAKFERPVATNLKRLHGGRNSFTFSRILAKFKAQNLIALDANNEILDIATNELSKMFES